MAVELRPVTALLVLVVVLLAGSMGSVVVNEVTHEGETTHTYLTIEGTDQQVWTYTSAGNSFEQATLALNAIVYGDPAEVRSYLLEAGRGDWNATTTDEEDVSAEEGAAEPTDTATEWHLATGSDRYTYLSGPGGGAWLAEAYQIHDGEYLGSRHHVRAYIAPGDDHEWTAMQAHYEHWDWFMARHVVTSVSEAQSHLEREFVTDSSSPHVQRVPVESDHTRVERWITVVDVRDVGVAATALLPVVVLGAIGHRIRTAALSIRDGYPEQDARTVLVGASIVLLVLGVRLTGIWLEQSIDVAPKTIAMFLYPVLFAVLPVLTYLLARPLDRQRAFIGGSVGFLAAVLLEYTYLGVTHVSVDVFVYRGALGLALGLIAVGSSREERGDPDRGSYVRFGVLLWIVATLLPLLRHTPLPL